MRRTGAQSGTLLLKRIYVLGGTASLTTIGAYEMYLVLEVGGITALEALVLILFVTLFAWIALSFLSTMAGFFVLVLRKPTIPDPVSQAAHPALASRTALLFPIYNEQPHHVFARVLAMQNAVTEAGSRASFDLFILSDTTDPDIWVLEEKLFLQLREQTASDNIFYRHRSHNAARKSGNIREWVTNFGSAYECMLILDADSLMTAECVVQLVAAMECHPHAGLIQTLPIIVNSRTPFSKLQQFAGRLYGPMIAAGIAWWHGSEGNYWGHNAIIRVRAFAETAGLPELRGRKPFGGHILSHDFVEAALMRRGGWAIYMAPALNGSYEECPATPIDFAARDRRWCQGNLQHAALLSTRGLHWVSRLHLLSGIGSYLTAPMWFAFLLLGIAISLQAQFVRPEYFPSGFSLFPKWPAQDPIRAIWVFSATMGLLLVPKLLSFVILLADSSLRKRFGGGPRTFAGMLLEIILSGLMAPVMMIFQANSVLEILLGRDVGWQVQRRADGQPSRSEVFRAYAGPTIIGALMAVSAYLVSTSLLLWMTPVVVGLMFSVPVALLVSSPELGTRFARCGLLATPEDIRPAAVVQRANASVADFESGRVDGLVRLKADKTLRNAHVANLSQDAPRKRGHIDTDLAIALAKVNDAESFDEALSFLTQREKYSLLNSSSALRKLFAKNHPGLR